MTPGTKANVLVNSILGNRPERRIGVGLLTELAGAALKQASSYLLRIEYPEDKPRYSPIEIQVGQNYMDVGWKNGISLVMSMKIGH